jgi:Lon protease-like protein/tetratricopeptide (TPR) repeat protein
MASLASSSPLETKFKNDKEKIEQQNNIKDLNSFINAFVEHPEHEHDKDYLEDHIEKFYFYYIQASRVGCRGHSKEDFTATRSRFYPKLRTDVVEDEQINKMPDLRCWYCLAHLNKPTTLSTGLTVCLACVENCNANLRDDVESMVDFAKQGRLKFGTNVNVTLSSVSKKCMQKSHLSGEKRQLGNKYFREKKYQEAIEQYTQALQYCPGDIVLYSNRAAAYIIMDLIEVEAIQDLYSAIYLLKAQHVQFAYPMYRKIFNRLITALEKLRNKKQASSNASKDPRAKLELFSFETLLLQAYVIGNGMLARCGTMENPLAQKYVKKGKAQLKKLILFSLKSYGKEKVLDMFCNVLFNDLNNLELLLKVEKQGFEFIKAKNVDVKRKITKLELENIKEDLECPLCMQMFYKPTTLPCGHVLCHPCLARTLDHAFQKPVNCPLCRSSLNEYLRCLNELAKNVAAHPTALSTNDNCKKLLIHGSAMIPIDKTLHLLLLKNFPEEYKSRELLAMKEEAPSSPILRGATLSEIDETKISAEGDTGDANNNSKNLDEIPIFICGLAYPGISFPLHVFEPRYRLMMRRCIEDGSRVFGMVMHVGDGSGSEFGTLVQIEDFKQLSDGRSRVDTVGTRRFKVLQYGEKDGYATGKVEYIEDSVDLSAAEIAEVSSLANQVKAIVDQSGHSRNIYMQLGKIPIVNETNPTYALNWFLIASDIFGIQVSQSTKYEFLFGDECRENKKKRLEKFKELFRTTPLLR